jgi:uncharacterized spore protein YtfJ
VLTVNKFWSALLRSKTAFGEAVSENDGETVIPHSKIFFEEFKMMKK